MSSLTDDDVARLAYDEGARQSALLKRFMDMDDEGGITEQTLDALWDDSDDRVVEILASYGNNIAARVLARRRQEAIEESLGEV